MGKGSFDGRMIGLSGDVVTFPRWLFMALQNAQRILDREARLKGRDSIKIIERDKKTGFFAVREAVHRQLGPFLDLPDYKLKPLRATDPSYVSGRPRITGRKGIKDLLELGISSKERWNLETQ